MYRQAKDSAPEGEHALKGSDTETSNIQVEEKHLWQLVVIHLVAKELHGHLSLLSYISFMEQQRDKELPIAEGEVPPLEDDWMERMDDINDPKVKEKEKERELKKQDQEEALPGRPTHTTADHWEELGTHAAREFETRFGPLANVIVRKFLHTKEEETTDPHISLAWG